MEQLAWIGALALALGASVVDAATMDFAFRFKNDAIDGETITGVVRGLTEGISPPTSVEVLSNTGGYGIGEYVGAQYYTLVNQFDVFLGRMQNFGFVGVGVDSGLVLSEVGVIINIDAVPPDVGGAEVIWTPMQPTLESPATIPVPASGLLFAGALFALVSTRSKPRKASARQV